MNIKNLSLEEILQSITNHQISELYSEDLVCLVEKIDAELEYRWKEGYDAGVESERERWNE